MTEELRVWRQPCESDLVTPPQSEPVGLGSQVSVLFGTSRDVEAGLNFIHLATFGQRAAGSSRGS